MKTRDISYDWSLKDYPKKNGYSVMSTFACGGGSTMGYKLAGFEVVAANDIDPKMAKVYKANHNPKQYFLAPIKELISRDDLPEVDILDGSPPCSTFSTTGLRDKAWGKNKKFREGQAEQILDDLFFDFIKLASVMKPKVVIAENVKGMLIGKAKGYTKLVVQELEALGYTVQVFLLNGATMGLPQRRERVFFIANRLGKRVSLDFKESPIPFREVTDDTDKSEKLTPLYQKYWNSTLPGSSMGKFASERKLSLDRVSGTIVSGTDMYHPTYRRKLNDTELRKIGSFPSDYDYQGEEAKYMIGMSVPPLMMYKVAEQVKLQILDKA